MKKILIISSLLSLTVPAYAQNSYGGTGGNGTNRANNYLAQDFYLTDVACDAFRTESLAVQSYVCRKVNQHPERYTSEHYSLIHLCAPVNCRYL